MMGGGTVNQILIIKIFRTCERANGKYTAKIFSYHSLDIKLNSRLYLHKIIQKYNLLSIENVFVVALHQLNQTMLCETALVPQ